MWAKGAGEAWITAGGTLHDGIYALQTGPVEEETFLKAAVEGKMKVIEKFLADGGSPDTCDQVMLSPTPSPVPASFSELQPHHTQLWACLRTGIPQKIWDAPSPHRNLSKSLDHFQREPHLEYQMSRSSSRE